MDEFPDVQHKLDAPKKLSAFEKERQAAALKQQRAEEENAAALRAFEDSFANDDEGDDSGTHDRGSHLAPKEHGSDGPRGRPGAPPMAPRSGPGSLGPLPPQRSGPGSLGPAYDVPPPVATRAPVLPFGAEKPRGDRTHFSMRNAPPPGQIAPPDSYDSPYLPSHGREVEPDAVVTVRPPTDIGQIRAIHAVAQHLLSLNDPKQALLHEALFMRLPEVRSDERMNFLYDSQSPEGIYYRWLLWHPDDFNDEACDARRKINARERIFSDVPIDWLPPDPKLQFFDLTDLAEVVTHIDYESSDEFSDEEDGEGRQYNRGPQDDSNALESGERQYLTPLTRARLAFLLARLPTSIARLRRGDIARVTNFAIANAGAGADEIANLILLNVAKPFCYTSAARFGGGIESSDQDDEDTYEPDDELSNLDSPAPAVGPTNIKKDDDGSNAKLIGVYVVSDILSASSTAGVRNAWRYRQLFEAGMKAQKTFARLGRVEKELGWGRIKSEQWKRKIEVILGLWESWSVFNSDCMDELRSQFFGERKEEAAKEEEEVAVQETIDERQDNKNKEAAETKEEDIDGVPMSDSDEG